MTDATAPATPDPPHPPARRTVRGIATSAFGEGANLVVWGSIIVSIMVTSAFILISLMMMNIIAKPVEDANANIINQMWAGMLVLQTGIVNYWCGSSAGSARKDHVQAAVLTSSPPPVSVRTGDTQP